MIKTKDIIQTGKWQHYLFNLRQHTNWIFLIFATTLTLVTLYLNNYQYGVGDQIIHIPYIKHLLENQLYLGDTLINVMSGKPTFFWEILLPIFRVFGMEKGMFVLQFASLLIFFYSIKVFTKEVTKRELASYLVLLMFIFPKYSYGYSSLFVYSSFIPRNLVIGFAILAVVFYVRDKKPLSYLSLGLLGNFHILTIVPILVSFLANDLITVFYSKWVTKKLNLQKLLICISLFFVGMLPLIAKYPAFIQSNTSDTSAVTSYIDYYKSVLTPFYLTSTKSEYLMLLNATLMVVLSIIVLQSLIQLSLETRRFLTIFVSTGFLLVVLSIFVEKYWPSPFLLQLQLGRSAQYSLLVFFTLIAFYIANTFRYSNKLLFIMTVTAALFIPNLSILLILLGVVESDWKGFKQRFLALSLAVFLIWVNRNTYDYYRYLKPSLDVYPLQNDNTQAQNWLRENTAINAKVLAPYYIGGFTEPDFRTLSDRSNVLTNADLVETILNSDALISTQNRINALTLGNYNLLMKDDNLFNYYVGRDLYHKALNSNFNEIIELYGISYIVTESEFDIEGQFPVYTNEKYKIYSTGQNL